MIMNQYDNIDEGGESLVFLYVPLWADRFLCDREESVFFIIPLWMIIHLALYS